MEEDGISLIDCLRVIWKRKILIIVGTLVGIVAGVTVSLRLPATYRAEVLMRIGKTVDMGPITSPSFALLDTIVNLVKTIPNEYALEDEGALEYDLNAEMVKGTSLIKIVLEGPDERKTKELHGKVVEKLTVDHLRKIESSIRFYKVLIGKLEADIKEIQNDRDRDALEFEEMNKEMNVEVDINEADPFTLMMIQNRSIAIQNRSIAIQNNLKQSRVNIRSIRDDIFLYQLTINTIEENKTRRVGGVVEICVKPKKIRNIMLAGVGGLMMSLFLAFFIEYLGNVREREGEKEKKRDDSV